MPEPTVYRLDLPWETPPLSLNDRRHWAAQAQLVSTVREIAGWRAKGANIGRHDRVRVTLNYQPLDRRRRDEDNLVATLKPLCDGLVDVGVVPDDTPDHMVKDMPVIHEPDGIRRNLWLDIEVLSDCPASAGSQPLTVGDSITFKDNPLLMRVAVALAGRVWTEPLPELSVGQWTEVVDVIAGCVRREDNEKRWLRSERRADIAADTADRGECA